MDIMILLMALQEALLVCVVLVSAAFISMGAMRVEVRSKTPGGEHLRLIAPASVLPAGAMLVPRARVGEAAHQLQAWIPTIQAASEELTHCPDATLVEVDSRDDHVKIAKIGGALVLDVDNQREVVHVSVPLRAAASACYHLAEKTQAKSLARAHPALLR